jgi:hypothetical protein
MGIGIGMFVLLLVLAAIFATKKLKIQKARKMREKFFKRNRGLLLRQLVDKDIAQRMIFSLEELEKATNKFDEARILGGGGHGTVYKGILSNQLLVEIGPKGGRRHNSPPELSLPQLATAKGATSTCAKKEDAET